MNVYSADGVKAHELIEAVRTVLVVEESLGQPTSRFLANIVGLRVNFVPQSDQAQERLELMLKKLKLDVDVSPFTGSI